MHRLLLGLNGHAVCAISARPGSACCAPTVKGEADMTEEPTESKLGKLNRVMWLISGIVTAILVVVIMVIIMMRGSGY